MTGHDTPLRDTFPPATEAAWLAEVSKALKGKGPDTLTRTLPGGLAIKALYRETDFPAAADPLGCPGEAPFLRGPIAAPDRFLPWDIRQRFTHPSPEQTNAEILRDLERGVTSVEIVIDPLGEHGVQVASLADAGTVLQGVRADIATVALSHVRSPGLGTAALFHEWGKTQDGAPVFAFNLDPLGSLARTGRIDGGLDAIFSGIAALDAALAGRSLRSSVYRIDASFVHEAGGSEAQELGALVASAIDTMRRLAVHAPVARMQDSMIFSLALDANYGIGIAKVRAARRLWARCLELMELVPAPMKVQAITSARMLTRYDPWTNMLRGACGAFAGAVGGADILTVRPFNEPLGVPEELGRRIARNTQIIAMEESALGRVADPLGGAWFTETLAEDLAEAAWAEFQRIESEGGLATSLIGGAFQTRVAEVRDARARDIARRKIPITGVSEFPLLEEIPAPIAILAKRPADSRVPEIGQLTPSRDDFPQMSDPADCPALLPVRLAEPFEALRDAAANAGRPPTVFLATLGSLAEFTARADFARNVFAAGGIVSKEPPVPPATVTELAAAFRASGCRMAVLCSTDKMYESEAAGAAEALKQAGAQSVWLAGKHEVPGIDANIFAGADVVHLLQLAHAGLGVSQ